MQEIRPYLEHFAPSVMDFYEQNLASKRLRQLEATQYIETDWFAFLVRSFLTFHKSLSRLRTINFKNSSSFKKNALSTPLDSFLC